MSVRAMLTRVKRLEAARAVSSPFQRWFGSADAFCHEVWAGIDAGTYDPRDMPVVIASIERWHSDGVFLR
ncbi:MAG TPA: hypothetical protein VLG14_01185 [Sphingomonas sp.]|nr:hypothetical protein [Sphingomonas sp.]